MPKLYIGDEFIIDPDVKLEKIELTLEEYESLEVKEDNKLYVITDAKNPLEDFYTKELIDEKISDIGNKNNNIKLVTSVVYEDYTMGAGAFHYIYKVPLGNSHDLLNSSFGDIYTIEGKDDYYIDGDINGKSVFVRVRGIQMWADYKTFYVSDESPSLYYKSNSTVALFAYGDASDEELRQALEDNSFLLDILENSNLASKINYCVPERDHIITSLSDIEIISKLNYCEISTNLVLSIKGSYLRSYYPEAHILIKNTADTDIEVTLPGITNESTLVIPSGKIGEVNIVQINNRLYTRASC